MYLYDLSSKKYVTNLPSIFILFPADAVWPFPQFLATVAYTISKCRFVQGFLSTDWGLLLSVTPRNWNPWLWRSLRCNFFYDYFSKYTRCDRKVLLCGFWGRMYCLCFLGHLGREIWHIIVRVRGGFIFRALIILIWNDNGIVIY